MANRVKMARAHSILTLRERGWSFRRIAREHGVQTFHAYVQLQNSGMLKNFHGSGIVVETTTEADVVRGTMKLPEEGPGEPNRA